MKKGKHSAVITTAKALIAVLLFASVVGLPMPKLADWWQGEVAEASDPPPGQLKRRGIVGNIVMSTSTATSIETATSTATSIDTDTSTSTPPTIEPDAYTITISTKFGDVTVLITDETVILAPPNGIISPDQIGENDRLAIHFKKRKHESATSTDAFLDSSARIALKIIVIPGKATRSHKRGVVKSKVKGKLRLVDGDGNETELNNAPDGLSDGDDVVVVARRRGRGSDNLEIRGFQPASHVAERLTNLIERARNSGNQDIVRRLQKQVDKVIDQLEDRLRKARARISSDSNAGDDNSDSGKGHRDRGRDLASGGDDNDEDDEYKDRDKNDRSGKDKGRRGRR